MVCAQAEFGRRADHSVGVSPVGLAGRDRKPAGQRSPGQGRYNEIAFHEVGCSTDDLALLPFNVGADVNQAGPDRLLESGELLDSGHPPDGQRAVDRAEGADLLDLVSNAHQRLLEFACGDIPARGAGRNDLAQPAVGKAHQAPTPNGNENRTSPSTMSRMSGMPLRNCRVRSSPIPNAKPEYTCASIPAARNTFGFTIPQPPHSTQPAPPLLFSNHTSTSADGSVKGKKCGRILVRACGPNSARANASSVPRRCAIDRPRSTASPST